MRQELSKELVAAVIALAQDAGEAIMEVYRAGEVNWTVKGDASPVSAADLRAHEVLVAGLAALTPGMPIVSEEGAQAVAAQQIGGQFWLLDPLDGTKEFISRNDEFTVNVALVEDGCPVFGVVVAPALGQAFWGARGMGACRIDAGGTRSIRTVPPGAGPLRVVASKSHMNEATQAFITGLGACTLVQAGSSLKICRIAEGAADLYPRLGPTCEWDTAAAHAVLEAAGGVLCTESGQALRYGKPEVLNPFFIASASGGYPPKEI